MNIDTLILVLVSYSLLMLLIGYLIPRRVVTSQSVMLPRREYEALTEKVREYESLKQTVATLVGTTTELSFRVRRLQDAHNREQETA